MTESRPSSPTRTPATPCTSEAQLHFEITGSVQAEVTLGSESMECGTLGAVHLHYASVTSSAGRSSKSMAPSHRRRSNADPRCDRVLARLSYRTLPTEARIVLQQPALALARIQREGVVVGHVATTRTHGGSQVGWRRGPDSNPPHGILEAFSRHATLPTKILGLDLVAGSHSRSDRRNSRNCPGSAGKQFGEKLTWDGSDDLEWLRAASETVCDFYTPTGQGNNYARCFDLPFINDAPDREQEHAGKQYAVAVSVASIW
ncbi:MAG TPA: hypothetical protein VI197_34065 [Polyangiaceae bacterium]